MPTFKEVAEKSLSANTENVWVYGQSGGHLANAPFKVRLLKLNPNDPNEPPRYAICHCGCADCRPGEPPTLRSKPIHQEKGHWVKRAEELAPLGRKGFEILLGELSQSGNQLAINVRKGVGR